MSLICISDKYGNYTVSIAEGKLLKGLVFAGGKVTSLLLNVEIVILVSHFHAEENHQLLQNSFGERARLRRTFVLR